MKFASKWKDLENNTDQERQMPHVLSHLRFLDPNFRCGYKAKSDHRKLGKCSCHPSPNNLLFTLEQAETVTETTTEHATETSFWWEAQSEQIHLHYTNCKYEPGNIREEGTETLYIISLV